MSDFTRLNRQDLQQIKAGLLERYHDFKARSITLDMTRGKPCPDQLDLSIEMLDSINSKNFQAEGALDCRNYGGLPP